VSRVLKLAMALFITLSLFTCVKVKAGDIELKALESASEKVNIDSDLLKAVCWVESSHNANAFNANDPHGGAVGLCQILLPTANWMMGHAMSKEELFEVNTNAYIAAKYIAYQLKRYNGNVSNAIAAYNAGTAIRRKYGSRKGRLINEGYVAKVLKAWNTKPWRTYAENYQKRFEYN